MNINENIINNLDIFKTQFNILSNEKEMTLHNSTIFHSVCSYHFQIGELQKQDHLQEAGICTYIYGK